MLSSNIKKVAHKNGWYKANGVYFGIYKEYFFNMQEGQGFKSLYAKADNLSLDEINNISQIIDKNKKRLKIGDYAVDVDGVFLKFTENIRQASVELIYNTMNMISEFYKSIKMSTNNNCHNCSTKENINYYLDNNVGTIYCKKCYGEHYEKYERAKIEYESEEKYYLKGSIGAFLFSIPGVILWIVFAIYFDQLSAACALIIGFLSFKGYQKFGGIIGPHTKWIVLFITILMVVSSNYLSFAIVLLTNGVPYDELIYNLFENKEIIVGIKKALALSGAVSFLALGWIYFVVLKSEPIPTILSANKV